MEMTRFSPAGTAERSSLPLRLRASAVPAGLERGVSSSYAVSEARTYTLWAAAFCFRISGAIECLRSP